MNNGDTTARMVAAYDDDGVCIAVADSVSDLAKFLGVWPSTVTRWCKSRKHCAYIMTDEELERYERDKRKRDARKAKKVRRDAENT